MNGPESDTSDSAATHYVALIVLGLGDQGKRALKGIAIAKTKLLPSVVLELISVIEPNKREIDLAKQHFPALFEGPYREAGTSTRLPEQQLKEILQAVFESQATLGRYKKCIVYDASPTQHHFKNFCIGVHEAVRAEENQSISRDFLIYFGEKPIITFGDQASSFAEQLHVDGLSVNPHWCNFTDTASAAYHALRRIVRAEKIHIEKLQVWRSNCVALEFLVDRRRKGITGGSFVDKNIHDLPLILGLLGDSYGEDTWESSKKAFHKVVSAHVNWYLPATLAPDGEADKFLAVSLVGDPMKIAPGTALPPAEADALLRIDFEVKCAAVQATLYSSWLGLEPKQKQQLLDIFGRFQLRLIPVIAEAVKKPCDLVAGYHVEEARILFVQGTDQSGSRIELISNFFSRASNDPLWRKSYQPWAAVKRGDDSTMLGVEDSNPLAETFEQLAFEAAGMATHADSGTGPHLMGHAASVKVHAIAKSVREKLKDIFDEDVDAGRAKIVDTRKRAWSHLIVPSCFKLDVEGY
ncbi:MAG: hypothetical protein L0387_34365 [Acidobacteria bacterium]|nr:hypothetical protein [Acidobacteriota bacterium]